MEITIKFGMDEIKEMCKQRASFILPEINDDEELVATYDNLYKVVKVETVKKELEDAAVV